MSILRRRIVSATLAWAIIGSLGCRFDSAEAPEGATLELAFPRGRQVTVDDTCTIAAILRLETGDLAGKDWTVDFAVDRGVLGTGTPDVSKRMKTNDGGVASVLFRAPADTGWVRLSVVTTEKKVVDSLRVVAPQKPEKPDTAAASAAQTRLATW
jgi:hypothetical protein